MMNFTLTTSEKLQKFNSIFSTIKNVSDAINLYLKPEGIYFQTMDSGHICMCEMKLASSWFDDYECEGEHVLGLNTRILAMVTSCFDEKQSLSWKYTGSTSDNLIISYKSKDEQSKEFNKDFEVPLIELDTEIMQVPEDSEWMMDIVIMSKRFTKIMSQFEMFGEEFTCKGTEDNLTFTARGDFGKVSACVDNDNLEEYSIAEDSTVEVSYALKYMKLITSFSKMSERTIANFSDSLPLRVQYTMDVSSSSDDEIDEIGIENMDECENYIRFFLAPKVDDF
jgi:proliferating cell nuclear antigen PCNA